MEALIPTTAFSRDALHRSIYDHFLWCSLNTTNNGNNTSSRPIDSTVEKNSERVTSDVIIQNNVTDLPLGDSVDAAVEEYPVPAMLQLGDTSTDNTNGQEPQPPAHHLNNIPAVTGNALDWQTKLQRILSVLEEEFSEMLQLPAEVLEGKACSDLELRFATFPDLEKRVQDMHGQMTEIPLLPPLALPTNATQQIVAATADIVVGAALDGIGLPLGNIAGMAPVGDTMNPSSKRKAPPNMLAGDQDHLQEPSKKLKSQAREIKSLKSQLQLFKRAKNSTASKKSRDNSDSASMETAKERAMAAAIPFDERFEELVHWSKGHGHCRIPCTSQDNPGLARWVQTLRAAYKEKEKRGKLYFGQLTDERITKLEGIGFEWSIQKKKTSWEDRFQELVQFKQEHGNSRVVRSNGSLGEWCHRQRFLAHKNQLDEDKVQQLMNLGFEIWVRKQGKSWEDHFEMLLEHRRKHGNLTVPAPDTRTQVKQVLKAPLAIGTAAPAAGESDAGNPEGDNLGTAVGAVAAILLSEDDGQEGPPGLDPATEEYKDEQAFRRWVVAQRDNYQLKYKKDIKSTLNKARVKKLDGIGFDWTRDGGDHDLRKVRTGALHHRNDPEIWNRRFQELVEYKKRFGDTNIPKEWPENKSLGAWVATQRKMYKALIAGTRSSLTPDRRAALESIGFTWILRPSRTRPKILEIEGMVAGGTANLF